MSMVVTAYKGIMIHSVALGELEILNPGLIGVGDDGKIVFVIDLAAQQLESVKFDKLVDHGDKILIPGFVDGHAHAPQYSFLGVGMHLPLLEWLNTFTFPHEANFVDPAYARNMFSKAVKRHVVHGTTTCSYFATIHLEACKVLADIVHDIGQRGYLGKVNMDRHAPPELTETTDGSLRDTRAFIEYVATKQTPLITPVITPRFVPNTTTTLMYGLAQLSNEHKLPIQSHLSENMKEVEWVRELYPDCSTYAEVYDRHGLMTERTYMAHCIWCSQDERSMIKSRGSGIIHCPTSNFSLSSGVLNVRRLIKEGVKVGLGTDVSAGYSTSMLDAIRHAVIASKVTSMTSPEDAPLTYAEAFHLATLGTAECLGLGNVIGNFLPTKELDMLVVDLKSHDTNVDHHDHDDILSQFQKFLFLGDDRNITSIYVRGRLIHSR
ncbi:hypothetical protein LEN26_021368 [Aphanomyces euteiches]|nr:hypothetical protein LEN26_021368 [Aphanomyces euteiches]